MIQNYETQLQVVLRALGETVLPALEGAEKHVIEQLQLTMAALAFMQQRLPHARRYHRSTLRSYLNLSHAIIDLLKSNGDAEINELESLVAKGRVVLQSPEAEETDYQDVTAELRCIVSAISAAAAGAGHEAALDALIIEHSGPILLNDRVWCSPLGFELRPQDLPVPSWMEG